MIKKPTYEELEQRVKKLKKKILVCNRTKKALELNRKIIAAAALGITLYDSSGQCVLANNAAAQLIGGTKEKLTSQNFRHLESWNKIGLIDLAEETLSKDESHITEITTNSTFGKKVSLRCIFVPIEFQNEQYLLLMFEEISARKRAEKALKESETNYREIFNAVNDGILVQDPMTGQVLDANQAIFDMFGYSREEMLSHSIGAVSAPSHTDEMARAMEKECLQKGENRFEWLGRKKDGTLCTLDVTLKLATIAGKQRIVGVSRDISERKMAEEELKRKSITLKEINTALHVLLKKREKDKRVIEENVLSNLKELILPYIQRLKSTSKNPDILTYLDILEKNLGDIVKPFSRKLSSHWLSLTPTEIQIADLVKQGQTT